MEVSMNCEEFLIQFREALDGKVSEQMIQDNVNYYRSYIYGQVREGKNEADVLQMLGDPRLLAKTIEESSKFASESHEEQGAFSSDNGSYGYAQGGRAPYDEMGEDRKVRLPGWFIAAIVIAVIVLVLSLVLKVFTFFAPVIWVSLLGYFVYRCVQSWFRER